ncbi:MAG TPA: hypothetical protein VH186_11765, partial [Chloroflexia bacterium]|nr:hypothetical protein [Chloroflexia bacterium]
STYTKFFDSTTNQASCAYDESGQFYAAWRSDRASYGSFNVIFARLLPGSNNPGTARNLTEELSGSRAPNQQYPLLGYSRQQHKLFLAYLDTASNGLYFTESANQGGTWSQPIRLGEESGYTPAEPAFIVDSEGLPHLFYGQFSEGAGGAGGSGKILHRMQRTDGSWTAPEIAGEGNRPVYTQVKLAPDGDLFLSWHDNAPVGLSRWNKAGGGWSSLTAKVSDPVVVESTFTRLPTLGITPTTGRLWAFWVKSSAYGGSQDEMIMARTSSDNGESWSLPQAVLITKEARLGRIVGINALASPGKLNLLYSLDQLDPVAIQAPSLYLSRLAEGVITPTTPTPGTPLPSTPLPTVSLTANGQGSVTPSASASPGSTASPGAGGGSATPAITATPAPAPTTLPETTLTVTPSATLTPSPSPTTGPQSDSFEPDNTLDQAVQHNRFLTPGKSEFHTLFDPTNPDGQRDTDFVLLQLEAGWTYTLDAAASGFNPLVKVYDYASGNQVGIATGCGSETGRVCYSFVPESSGVYWAELSDARNDPGSPSKSYLLSVTASSPATPTASPSVVPTVTATANATTLPPTNTPTLPPPTATPMPPIPTSPPLPPAPPQPQPSASQVAIPFQAQATPMVSPVKASPNPLPAEILTATAYSQAQDRAALSPGSLVVPLMPPGKGGQGPVIVLPTATPPPTATIRPTTLPTARPTVAAMLSATPQVRPAITPGPGTQPSKPQVNGGSGGGSPALWLLPVGVALAAKGLLNLLAARAALASVRS